MAARQPVCGRRRARAWRYENAEIALTVCVRCDDPSESATLLREHQARLALLKKAELEIDATGKLSEELKGKMFADAETAELWKFSDEYVSDLLVRRIGVPFSTIKDVRDSHPDASKNFLLGTAHVAAALLVRDKQRLAAGAAKLASDVEAIPRPEVLDRLLRAEAATERSLNRAIDRLERLQRRRKGETVPPPLRVSI